MTNGPGAFHQREIGDSHQTLDGSIQRKNEREVGEAKDPILGSIWDSFLSADKLENVGEVGLRRSEGEEWKSEISLESNKPSRKTTFRGEGDQSSHADGRRETDVGGVDDLLTEKRDRRGKREDISVRARAELKGIEKRRRTHVDLEKNDDSSFSDSDHGTEFGVAVRDGSASEGTLRRAAWRC